MTNMIALNPYFVSGNANTKSSISIKKGIGRDL